MKDSVTLVVGGLGAADEIILRDVLPDRSRFRDFPAKMASSCQKSFQLMMRRKFFSVIRNEAGAQRSTMAASRQRQTRRVRMRTPNCGLSITGSI
jgi:hypothetical protein